MPSLEELFLVALHRHCAIIVVFDWQNCSFLLSDLYKGNSSCPLCFSYLNTSGGRRMMVGRQTHSWPLDSILNKSVLDTVIITCLSNIIPTPPANPLCTHTSLFQLISIWANISEAAVSLTGSWTRLRNRLQKIITKYKKSQRTYLCYGK